MSEKVDISVVIPLLDEEESLEELHDWISRVMKTHGFNYEIIFIDDGSTDGSWKIITKLCLSNPSVRALRFYSNQGKSAALDTGFKQSVGNVVITMDADLQDSPEEIPELYRMVSEEGYDIVSGWKKKRHDPISKTFPSKFFNLVTRMVSGIKLHDFNCGLKAYNSAVVHNIEVYGEMHRYIPVIAKWKGFRKIGEKVVQHQARKYGHTKYGITRYLHGFLDIISITFVSRFGRRPMHFFGTMGTLSFIFGLLFVVNIVWQKVDAVFFSKVPMKREITEIPLFYLALVALVVGVQLFLTGFIAEMLNVHSVRKNYPIKESIRKRG